MSAQTRRCLVPLLVLGLFCGGLAHGADPLKGKEKSTVCAACHGADGNSQTPEFPRIAGQHEDYLLRALLDYKRGDRKNPIMAAQVENLEKQDLADLAAWYASQSGLVLKR
ncbi:MAG: cytochrome C [Azoarcus sp.]|nr:MAG: cytochrome C [Azoarcus sp.]|tara:strand:- start:76529 stop:76861 length:333 start_codon:yes stop_codon:yes gene_type:complete